LVLARGKAAPIPFRASPTPVASETHDVAHKGKGVPKNHQIAEWVGCFLPVRLPTSPKGGNVV